MKYQSFFHWVPALLILLVFSACNTPDAETETESTEGIGEVNKQVNEVPIEKFNKTPKVISGAVEGAPAPNLSPVQEPLPEKVDAILSRESIVIFSQRIMEEMPDELEFTQTELKHYKGPGDWSAFVVRYVTKPGGVHMVIYGAYESPDKVYWASGVAGRASDYSISAVEAAEGGAVLYGMMEGENPFRAKITAESVEVTVAAHSQDMPADTSK